MKMDHYIGRNTARLCGKLNEFRAEEKYTDVTIKCEDRSFKCHRVTLAAASVVFDRMFNSNFKEKVAESVLLPEISAETFHEILQFIYTGDVPISSDNLYKLIEASEFLELSGIDELCVQFLSRNTITVQSTLETFAFACRTRRRELVDALSKIIARRFRIFSKTSEFFDVPFDDLKIILKQIALLPRPRAKYDEVCDSIIMWVQHRRDERVGLIDQIADEIQFDQVSPEYLKCIFKKLMNDSASGPTLANIADSASHSISTEISGSLMEKHLYVYVKYPEENLMKILSVGSKDNIGDEFSAIGFGEVSSIGTDRRIRSIVLHDSHIYCLNYARGTADDQSFNRYTSVDLSSASSLMPPPVILDNFQMSHIHSNIYAYNRALLNQRFTAPGLTEFSEEEIGRGIYFYSCHVDNWFPVAATLSRSEDSSMIACDDVLYMIGGVNSLGIGNIQAYDHRIGKWRAIKANNKSPYTHKGADCCVMNGKIYVCGGGGPGVATYDPVAGKWNQLASLPIGMQNHRVVSYENRMWAMGEWPVNDLSAYIYDPVSDSWSTSEILVHTSQRNMNSGFGTIVDCIVF